MYNSIEFSKNKTIADKVNYLNEQLPDDIRNYKVNFKLDDKNTNDPCVEFFNDVMRDKCYVNQIIFNLIINIINDIAQNAEHYPNIALHYSKYRIIFIDSIILNPHLNNDFIIKNINHFKRDNYLINKRKNKLVYNREFIEFIISNNPELIMEIMECDMSFNTWLDYENHQRRINYLRHHFIPKIPFDFWLSNPLVNYEDLRVIHNLLQNCKFSFEQICKLILHTKSFDKSCYEIIKRKFNNVELRSIITLIKLTSTNSIFDNSINE